MIQKFNIPSVLHNLEVTFFDSAPVKLIIACFASIISLITNWNRDLIFLMFLFYFIDLITWSILATKKWEFNSSRFFVGVTKIIVYMIYLTIAVSTDMIIHFNWIFLYAVLSMILVTDSISILENLKWIWYKVPIWYLNNLKEILNKITNNEKK